MNAINDELLELIFLSLHGNVYIRDPTLTSKRLADPEK